MGRINKGLRLPQDALARAAHLRSYHPEHVTEAAMLNAILYRGLLVMEAELLAGGGPPPPGYTAQQVVAMALPALLPALQLLTRGEVVSPPEAARGAAGAAGVRTADLEDAVDSRSGEELGRLGSHFL